MKQIDIFLLAIVILLTLFGLFMVYDASSFIAFRDFKDKYYYIREQSLWVGLGFAAMVFFSYFDYRKLYNFAIVFLIVSIGLLVLVFLPGIGVYALGAHRWINLGFTTLQPAEFVKLSLAIYLAAWFSHKEKGRLTAFLMLLGLVCFLVVLQPDMGTASIILFEALMVYFLSGANVRQFVMLIPVFVLLVVGLIMIAPYRMSRLTAFLRIDRSLGSASYHVKQILIALGSGGVLGVGVGNSLQKYAYLPENVTDSIFPVIAEEFGFIGAAVLIAVYVLFIWRGFLIASMAKDTFGKLLGGGIMAFLGIQIFVNLAAMTALLPLTGVPLPFISYGGSALVIDLTSVGILLNIAKQKDVR